MEKIDILFNDEIFAVNVSTENAFPNNLIKVEFENNQELMTIIKSPVYLEEKNSMLSFTHIDVKNREQLDLLISFALAIEELIIFN